MRTRYPVIIILGIVLFCILTAETRAIPAFARKYKFSCTTCHSPFPRLKAFGEEFAGRGFRMDDPSKEPTRATYDVGDPLLKLVRELPLAIRIEGFASVKPDDKAKSDFEWPWVFKILSGGPITQTISYYFYFLVEQGEIVGLEDAYLQFNSIFSLPVDLLIGQFQVCDPMFKRELRLERYDYEILKANVGESAVDLTYDRGLMTMWHAPAGLEFTLGLINGNGIGLADESKNFDSDRYKNLSLRVSRMVEPVRLGFFAYLGKEKRESGMVNRTTYFGPDLVIDIGDRFQLSLEYLVRHDDDPFFAGNTGSKYATKGGFAELHFFPQGADGRWIVTALYNKVISDDKEAEIETMSLTLNHLIARNVRLLAEAGRDLQHKNTRLTIGFITAF